MKLIAPALAYKQAYLIALQDAANETSDTKLNAPEEGQSFEDFVQMMHDHAQGRNIPEGRVATSMFWLIDNDKVIGRLAIRHTLNEALRQRGGHIGYYIVPSERLKGYGREILRLGLIEAKKLGIARALLTCNEDNIGSQKIIEANKGELQDIVFVEGYQKRAKRFWISL